MLPENKLLALWRRAAIAIRGVEGDIALSPSFRLSSAVL